MHSAPFAALMETTPVLEEELTGSELQASEKSRPQVVVFGLLLASALLGFAAHAYLQKPVLESHLYVDMANLHDIQRLLEVVHDVYGDESQEIFDHSELVDIDASDPTNIKFEPKKQKYPEAPPVRQLQDSPKFDMMTNLNYAMCGIDAWQLLVTTGQIITNYKSTIDACKSPYPQDGAQQDLCANLVALNIAIWGYWIIYIEDMVSTCANSFNIKGGCAIDVTGLFTNGALAASAAAGMKANCEPPGGYKSDHEDLVNKSGGNWTAYQGIQKKVKAMKQLLALNAAAGQGFRRLEALEAPDFSEVQDTTGVAEGFLQNLTFHMFERQSRWAFVEEVSKLPEEKAMEIFSGFYENITQDFHRMAKARSLAEGTLPEDPVMDLMNEDGGEAGENLGFESESDSIQTQAAMAVKSITHQFRGNSDIQAKGREAISKIMPDRDLNNPGSLIKKINDEENDENLRNWKRTACAFDLGKATGRVAQFGTLIAMSTLDCSAKNFAKNLRQGHTKCAIDVTGIIASAGIVASMITISTVNCPATLEFTKLTGRRFCAASIIDLVTAVTYISTSIASIDGTCGTLNKYPGVPGTPFDDA